jgi:cation diffusion facilitator family transporter
MGAPGHHRRASRAAAVSVAASGALTVAKFVLGVVTGSAAIVSEAVHSGTDLLAALIAWWAIRAAAKPPDREHPYGHERAENLAALLEGALVVAAGVIVVVEGVRRLVHGGSIDHIGVAIAVMSASALVSFAVSVHLGRAARATGSPALVGDATHLRTDALMTVGVVAGLVLVAATGIQRADPAVALIVGILIIGAGVRLCSSSAHVLADSNLPEDEIARVEKVLRRFEGEGLSFHKLRGRRAGTKRHIDLHMVVAPATTVREGHRLSGLVKTALVGVVPNAEVLIHLEDHEPGNGPEPSRHESGRNRP